MKISEQKIAQLLANSQNAQRNKERPPLYKNVYDALKQGILTHELPNNCELPPTRKLAEKLRVSRSTIVKVYELLRLEGIIISKKGSGNTVHYEELDQPKSELNTKNTPHADLSKIGTSFYQNVSLVNTLDDKAIAFRPGLPPLDIFPVTQWKKQTNTYWQFVKASELSYHSEAGEEALRKSITNYLNLTRNVKCDYRQVFVVSGSLQSLFLIGSLLLNPGDGVLLENPTFPNVHSVFKGLLANIGGIELDEEGINLNQAKSKKYKHAKLMHVTPSCHYPLGVQMSSARRKELIEFAAENNVYLIENDYEHEVNHHQSATTPLFTLDREDRTFYLSTFNRILHPSIRIGFMVVPKQFVAPMKALMRHSHLFVSPSIQYTLNSFIDNKFLHKHVEKLHETVNEREQIVRTILAEKAGDTLALLPTAVPSLHLTARLKSAQEDHKVVKQIQEAGVITHALSKCYITGKKQHGLIIGHSCIRPQHIKRELAKLIEAVNAS